MRIPPLYKQAGWQRFLVGFFLGGIISYFVYLFMYGTLYEEWVKEKAEMEGTIHDLERDIEVLKNNNEEINELKQEGMVIDEITVQLETDESLELDKLIEHELKEAIKEEARHMVGRSVNGAVQSTPLLLGAIENKEYELEGFRYKVAVKQLIISEILYLTVTVETAI
ncbi:hypothetical protein SAMN05421503_3444 [Terribacillus aidingensis]|uniref:Sporulation membrane protein YtrI C-terminal domain-containing protein n=1 Tax=Terribacillus aidingensis TaxID=586416 RepID=A0A285PDV5_9BACI|nr:sporulation membrane protein YtrI [Terribacillus aidingensis]SNZ18051.1 hypothetical protein SAMN05421503_3444 [Terribacillus aidingensis]